VREMIARALASSPQLGRRRSFIVVIAGEKDKRRENLLLLTLLLVVVVVVVVAFIARMVSPLVFTNSTSCCCCCCCSGFCNKDAASTSVCRGSVPSLIIDITSTIAFNALLNTPGRLSIAALLLLLRKSDAPRGVDATNMPNKMDTTGGLNVFWKKVFSVVITCSLLFLLLLLSLLFREESAAVVVLPSTDGDDDDDDDDDDDNPTVPCTNESPKLQRQGDHVRRNNAAYPNALLAAADGRRVKKKTAGSVKLLPNAHDTVAKSFIPLILLLPTPLLL